MSVTFYCPVCGCNVPAKYLDQSCLTKANTGDPLLAIKRLHSNDLICQACQDMITEQDTEPDPPRARGRDVDAYYDRYSGVHLDRSTIDWLRQNY